ncbi:phosphatidylinositol-glycan biosynthesis class X protein-like [Planoprotostelium fungivorum]|uniref:Phosphatidylinositol-glycan biosynthesis class X protein-like n=1 Tax=Planoprotostelium fungivorum TaxID=1890364 RepID=A0A2P6NT52_9EUKA|nr:phosphatidylinositol-glycan biosynthesis class X protein-like [Planoprotostelium fungivorum]
MRSLGIILVFNILQVLCASRIDSSFPFASGSFQSLAPLHSLPANAKEAECKVTATVNRELLNEGFHKRFRTEVRVEGKDIKNCVLLSIEDLNESFYVDRYQLRDEEEWNSKMDNSNNSIFRVRPASEMDLERPSHLLERSNSDVYVFSEGSKEIIIDYPLHLRYHPVRSDVTHTHAVLPKPRLFMQCGQIHWNDVSKWEPLCNTGEDLQVKVPVGSTEDRQMVSVATIIACLLGTFLVAYSTLKYS